ncbi:MAG TPA: hypothetical protein VFT74_09405 [Isosphaeraceae bacterium]|nr:hypothetical protein [Isosphaeraceae bacterium]
MNDQRAHGCSGNPSSNKSPVPESQHRALDRRQGLNRQQNQFRKTSEPARDPRNRPPG